jgi:hypothetical protein
MTPIADPDPLEDLRSQVRATQEAAARLIGDVPPGGWEAPRERTDAFGDEVQALASLLQSLREVLPPDLREQVTELIRQLLLVLRALIDWWVLRLEEAPPGAAAPERAVEDIPIA